MLCPVGFDAGFQPCRIAAAAIPSGSLRIVDLPKYSSAPLCSPQQPLPYRQAAAPRGVMLALVWGAIWGVLVIYLLSRVLRQFYAFRETTLMASSGGADMPAVSIIVPVRNEFDNIEQCIA